MRTVLDIINIAKVSEYLSMNTIQLRALYGGGLEFELPYKIYNVRKSLEWAYNNQPEVPTTEQKNELAKSANYIYSLCAAFSLRAEDIITSYNTKTLTLIWYDLESAQSWLEGRGAEGNLNNINNWNIAFGLPENGNPFNGVSIVNTTINLSNAGKINLPFAIFNNINNINQVIDEGVILEVGGLAFGSTYGLSKFHSLSATNILGGAFADSSFLTDVSLPNAKYFGNGVFDSCVYMTSIYLPKAKHLGFSCCGNLIRIETMDFPMVIEIEDFCFQRTGSTSNSFSLKIPSCVKLGSSVGNNNVFDYVSGISIDLTIPSALMTCNEGNPDGDIQYLQANNTVTIIEV
jgi:hypothetical protein